MKSGVFLLKVIFIALVAACKSGNGDSQGKERAFDARSEVAEIVFNEYEYDFGKIAEGEKVAHIFAFQNKGPGRLVIASAATSCGCTIPRFDKNPIPPGNWGNLEVVFNSSGRSGIQTKTVTVRSNAETKVVILKITAEVMPDKR